MATYNLTLVNIATDERKQVTIQGVSAWDAEVNAVQEHRGWRVDYSAETTPVEDNGVSRCPTCETATPTTREEAIRYWFAGPLLRGIEALAALDHSGTGTDRVLPALTRLQARRTKRLHRKGNRPTK